MELNGALLIDGPHIPC